MARVWKLTWQTGADRNGRWKKIYKGVTYYFEGGRGKTDDEAYERALQAWQLLKTQLDAEADTDKPHRVAYETAIRDWETLQAWAREQGHQDVRAAAAVRLADLRARFALRRPPPLTYRDRPSRRDQLSHSQLLERLAPELQMNSPGVSDSDVEDFCNRIGIPIDDVVPDRVRSGLAQVVSATVWKDRLDGQKQKVATTLAEQTVSHQVAQYVAIRGRSGITAGAADNIRRRLEFFSDYVGTSTAVTEINARTLDDFHGHLIEHIDKKLFTTETSKNTLQTLRSWVRWLWQQNLIVELPRNINSPAHRIRPELKTIQTVSAEQVRELYTAAKPNIKLYLLLAINCGMTQIDIAELRPNQVDFAAGTLTRKRGKTKHVAGVPTVTYPLWPETLRLLKQVRSNDPDRLLLAPGGGPLKFEVRRGDKTSKHDFIGLAFRRLAKRLEITAPFKSLKKTSASFLRNHVSYIGLEGLFLDHAPRSVSDRHYAAVPTKLFAEAVNWLRDQYKLTPQRPQGRPPRPEPTARR